MRATAVLAIAFMAYAFPALAATEDECDRSWNAMDVNRDGVLRGAEAKRFIDDLQAKGVMVYPTRKGDVTARQYKSACIRDFWANLDDEYN